MQNGQLMCSPHVGAQASLSVDFYSLLEAAVACSEEKRKRLLQAQEATLVGLEALQTSESKM